MHNHPIILLASLKSVFIKSRTAVLLHIVMSLQRPSKKEKGQTDLNAADQWLSSAISQVKQPIKSFFNWIHEKTGI